MIGRQVKICTGFTQSIQILRRKKIKKIYCPMTVARENKVAIPMYKLHTKKGAQVPFNKK